MSPQGRRAQGRAVCALAQAVRTFSARGPFGPCPLSNVTGCPSRRVSNGLPTHADWWKKYSLPSEASTNPKPFSLTNRLTVPLLDMCSPIPNSQRSAAEASAAIAWSCSALLDNPHAAHRAEAIRATAPPKPCDERQHYNEPDRNSDSYRHSSAGFQTRTVSIAVGRAAPLSRFAHGRRTEAPCLTPGVRPSAEA